ncbi:hypothetical protein A2U01_0022753, partial [Trifolium medium]|nr:hypothetical protein [Trifolium medium]
HWNTGKYVLNIKNTCILYVPSPWKETTYDNNGKLKTGKGKITYIPLRVRQDYWTPAKPTTEIVRPPTTVKTLSR